MQEGFRTMTMRKPTRTILAACSAVALSAAVYGCGGGGGAPPVTQPPVTVDLSGVAPGYTLVPDTYKIEAGGTLTVGDVTFTCAAGDVGCTLTVAEDGTVTYAAAGGKVTAASSPAYAQRSALGVAVAAAQAAVSALDEASTDAAIAAAGAAIARAERAVSDGTLLTDGEKSAATATITASKTLLEGVTVGARIRAADSAIAVLTAMSTDADAAAAQRALDAAKAALAAVKLLPASEVFAFQDRIAAAGRRLETVKAAISDHKTHQSQLGAANGAVSAAEKAVNALTAASTDAEVSAAERAIAAAKAAIAAGTLLTAADVDKLNGTIALVETSLTNIKAAIDNRKTHGAQLVAVNAAVGAAKKAVDALDMTSTDEAIAAAQALIDKASKAVSDGTLLTAAEKSAASATITDSMTSLERVTVGARIHAANIAIAGLTATSTDAEVEAAQAAISAATAAWRKVKLLTGPEVIAFQTDIDAARTALAAKRTLISDNKTHQQQLTALTAAVSAAKAAVDALDRTSADADIAAAQARIDAAEAEVLAGTKLTVEEKSEASEKIKTSRTALEYVTVEAKVHAAETAVDGLTVASTEADVSAAQAAIAAADAALDKVTLLTAKQALAFRDSIDAAQVDLDTVKTQIADSKEHGRQLKALKDAVDAASKAVSGLSADSTDAEADAAAGKIQDAKDALAAGTALTAAEKAAATKTITAAEGSLTTRRAAIKARRDDARAMSAALTGTLGTFDPADVAHVVDGGVVSGTDNYERSATDTAPALSGWVGSVWEAVTRDTAAKMTQTDTVVVYTDKSAPKSARYTTYYVRGTTETPTTGTSAGFSWQPWVGVAGVSNDTNGILDLIEGTAIGAADVDRLFGAGNFGAGQEKLPAKGVTFTYEDENVGVADTQVEIAGSFHGVAGTFKCTGTTCTAERSNAGALTLAGDGAAWTFVPTSTNVMVAGAQQDADYLDFGYWVENDMTDASDPYTVDAFFRGKDSHDAVGSVVGTASYSGKAAGLYARQVYEGNTLLDDRSGRFTADVALTAYFGGEDIAASLQNSISGTISNFMDGGQTIDGSWSVGLNKIGGSTGGTGTFDTSAGTFTGGTTAGGGAAGTWSGRFYGDDEAVNDVTPQPGSVAGEFTAGFRNGAVVGAFGARK